MKGSDLRKIWPTNEKTETMTDLRDRLLEVFDGLGSATVVPDQAKELSNVAGKIIKSVAVQVEYAALRKDSKEIPFLK